MAPRSRSLASGSPRRSSRSCGGGCGSSQPNCVGYIFRSTAQRCDLLVRLVGTIPEDTSPSVGFSGLVYCPRTDSLLRAGSSWRRSATSSRSPSSSPCRQPPRARDDLTDDPGPEPPGDQGPRHPRLPDSPSKLSWDRVYSFAGNIVAPATALSTLLFYFGYVSTRAQYLYFGLDVDTIGLSTQAFVMRSPQPLLVPVLVLFLLVAGGSPSTGGSGPG